MPSPTTLTLRDISFSYNTSPQTLFSQLDLTLTPGFIGIVGANGSGKSTLLRLICRQLEPSSGTIEGSTEAIYCEQRCDSPPEDYAEFTDDWSRAGIRLRAGFGIENDAQTFWSHLSYGERKRRQIAHALWQTPEILALDEPTNHLDDAGRTLLIENLRRFKGIGLLVSHDRNLLDALCNQILWLDAGSVHILSGNYSEAATQRAQAQERAVHHRRVLKKQHQALRLEAAKRRQSASAEHRNRSKRGIKRSDHDAKAKINLRRVTDSGAGQPLKRLDSRVQRTEAQLKSHKVQKVHRSGVWLNAEPTRRDAVLDLPPGQLSMTSTRSISWPPLHIHPRQRIALIGHNGAGKSTFLKHLAEMQRVEDSHTLYLPQDIPAKTAQALLAKVKLKSAAELGALMNIVSRLNSRPEALLASQQPSPGEIRKLMLAEGLSRDMQLLMLDEPTNHMDLPSIEALEHALADCPCAMVIVSHDSHLIDHIDAERWYFRVSNSGRTVIETV